MSLRLRVLNLVEIVSRVPPSFSIDEILKVGLGIHALSHQEFPLFDENYYRRNTQNFTVSQYNPLLYRVVVVGLIRSISSTLGCGIALCLFMSNTKHLMVVYMYLTSLGVVCLSYSSNTNTVMLMTDPEEPTHITTNLSSYVSDYSNLFAEDGVAFRITSNCISQAFLAYVFVNIHLGPRYPTLQKSLPVTFFVPFSSSSSPLPQAISVHTPIVSASSPSALIKFVLWTSLVSVVHIVYNGYVHARNFVSNFGMSASVEAEWQRLNVPEVLRTFWLSRVSEHTSIFFSSGYWEAEDGYSPYFRSMKYSMVTGCDTVSAVLGITSIVSYICSYIGKSFQWISSTDDDNDKNIGTVSAIVFYILASQTGLTSSEPEVRFVRSCRNFGSLFTAILHFIHNVVNPSSMSSSASHNPSVRRHVHASLVCLSSVVLPSFLMFYLWSTQETSTWLSAVTAFSIEVIVKVFVSSAIYALFSSDARRETFWEKSDDYIYYIRAFGNTIEFCFGIFLFFNGAWISSFESGSAIRAVMMCIHAYFNIWCDAKAGWSVFMKRRTAVNKIESSPDAIDDELAEYNDVCAICYQEMRSAKITRCRHFFHGVCSRKWSYVQDRCPLCHEILHGINAEEKKVMITPAPDAAPEDDR